MYPVGCPYPMYGYPGNYENQNSSWLWIVIIIFVIFFIFWGAGSNNGCNHGGCGCRGNN